MVKTGMNGNALLCHPHTLPTCSWRPLEACSPSPTPYPCGCTQQLAQRNIWGSHRGAIQRSERLESRRKAGTKHVYLMHTAHSRCLPAVGARSQGQAASPHHWRGLSRDQGPLSEQVFAPVGTAAVRNSPKLMQLLLLSKATLTGTC